MPRTLSGKKELNVSAHVFEEYAKHREGIDGNENLEAPKKDLPIKSIYIGQHSDHHCDLK